MIEYPRVCKLCNRTYISCRTFSQHRKKCYHYAAQYEIEQKKIAVAARNAIVDITVNNIDTQARDSNAGLQKQVDMLTRELELIKLQQDKSDRKMPLGYVNGHSIYLAQTRDCFDKDNNVFKIGRTTDLFKRKSGYPKGTIFLLNRLCLDAQEMESRILTKAAALYKRRPDYGTEYFEASLDALIDLIHEEMNWELKKAKKMPEPHQPDQVEAPEKPEVPEVVALHTEEEGSQCAEMPQESSTASSR